MVDSHTKVTFTKDSEIVVRLNVDDCVRLISRNDCYKKQWMDKLRNLMKWEK